MQTYVFRARFPASDWWGLWCSSAVWVGSTWNGLQCPCSSAAWVTAWLTDVGFYSCWTTIEAPQATLAATILCWFESFVDFYSDLQYDRWENQHTANNVILNIHFKLLFIYYSRHFWYYFLFLTVEKTFRCLSNSCEQIPNLHTQTCTFNFRSTNCQRRCHRIFAKALVLMQFDRWLKKKSCLTSHELVFLCSPPNMQIPFFRHPGFCVESHWDIKNSCVDEFYASARVSV